MSLKGVCFLITGVLLLGHIPALAEPYPMERKDGVVFYHFVSREPAPNRAGKSTQKIRGEAWVQVSPARLKPSLAAAKRPTQVESRVKPAAVSPSDAPALTSLRPATAETVQLAKPKNAKRMTLAGTGYLIGLLTKLGCRYPLVSPAYGGYPRVGRSQDVPAAQASQIAVPEGWKNLLKYAQEQPAFFMEAGSFGYRFPVAGPFSFRDSWGDSRSGGRMHRAVDIFAAEGSPVYAITTGIIDSLATLPGAGITLFLKGHDGRGYGYMHLQGYAPGLVEGKLVWMGDLVGYVGRTGMQTSAAHLHLQVYADHRLGRDELLNPYSFLVRLCHGIGVTDLYQHQIASLEYPRARDNGIKVYRSAGSRGQGVKHSSVLVIRNY